MEKAKHSIRFEAEVDARGNVTFSKQVAALQLKPGTKVSVNIFGGVVSEHLAKRGVSEAEIEQIGNRQFEDREHVMSFLSSQGALSGNKRFTERLKRMTA
jgi:hypothetical protein